MAYVRKWGLLVNSGYLTALKRIDSNTAVVKIPDNEVMSESQVLIAKISGTDGMDLQQMLSCLINKDIKRFFELYQDIVISCTSYMDAKENAYHMLFLGMCITLRGTYKVTSNIEAGFTFLKEIDDHLNAAIIVLEGEEYHGNRYRDRTKPIWFTCKTSQSAVKAYYGIYK